MEVTKKNKWMAILAYIGILIIVSFIVGKDDQFVKFHIKQGLVLLCIDVISWILTVIFPPFIILYKLIQLCILILAIIGIVNAAHRREKMLPIVGQYSRYFNF